MLVVKVELHSARTGEVTEIGRSIIANVGGSDRLGDYDVMIGRKPSRGDFDMQKVFKEPLRRGRVDSYPRLSYNVWRLVIRALLSAFPEEENLRLRRRDSHD